MNFLTMSGALTTGTGRRRIRRLHEGIRPPPRKNIATNDFQRRIDISNSLSNSGTRFYIPNVRKYFITEDTCAACHNRPSGVSTWVDMWVGGNGSNNAGVLACENKLTGIHTIIRYPDAMRVVVSGSLFNSTTGTCAAQFGG
jgi:hypothetical protein